MECCSVLLFTFELCTSGTTQCSCSHAWVYSGWPEAISLLSSKGEPILPPMHPTSRQSSLASPAFMLTHFCQKETEDRERKKKIPADSHLPSFQSHCFAVQVFQLSLYQGTGLDRSPWNQITDFYLFNFSSQHVGSRTDTRRGSRQGTGMGGGGH